MVMTLPFFTIALTKSLSLHACILLIHRPILLNATLRPALVAVAVQLGDPSVKPARVDRSCCRAKSTDTKAGCVTIAVAKSNMAIVSGLVREPPVAGTSGVLPVVTSAVTLQALQLQILHPVLLVLWKLWLVPPVRLQAEIRRIACSRHSRAAGRHGRCRRSGVVAKAVW